MSARQKSGPHLLILNVGQAEAVYGAMCALNNVGAFIETAVIPNGEDLFIDVCQHPDERIEILSNASTENYDSQHAFAAVYGLNPDALKPER